MSMGGQHRKSVEEESHVFNPGHKNVLRAISVMNELDMNQEQAKLVCITGGPCAGKTSGLAYVTDKLRENGFNV